MGDESFGGLVSDGSLDPAIHRLVSRHLVAQCVGHEILSGRSTTPVEYLLTDRVSSIEMSPDVRPRRYDSSRRQAQAAHSRRMVIDAARRLFLERGFAASTMPAIATAAGVSVQTVYKAFGSKPRLAK